MNLHSTLSHMLRPQGQHVRLNASFLTAIDAAGQRELWMDCMDRATSDNHAIDLFLEEVRKAEELERADTLVLA